MTEQKELFAKKFNAQLALKDLHSIDAIPVNKLDKIVLIDLLETIYPYEYPDYYKEKLLIANCTYWKNKFTKT